MVFTHQDIQEFDKQIKELLNKRLIRNSGSSHTSYALMVRDHDEEKGEKVRMVINYKKLNDNTVSMVTIFSIKQFFLIEFEEPIKTDTEIIKMDEESIPLTAFNIPEGHYE